MPKFKYEPSKVIKALKESNGLVTHAAKLLGCDYHTVQNYINRHKKIQKVQQACREVVSDMAENNLYKNIKEGDVGLSQWWLTKHRRERFGNEAVEVNVKTKLVIGLPDSLKEMLEVKDE